MEAFLAAIGRHGYILVFVIVLAEALGMPVAEGPGEGRFVVDATGAHARPAQPPRRTIPVTPVR